MKTWFVPTGLVASGGVIWMFASTNVFTASPEFGATPSVATVIGDPLTESVEVACPVTLPAVGELKVIVHCPAASVFAPAFVHVPVGAVCAAPLESVNVTSTCSPAAGTKPAPMSFCRVTVKVCGAPTSLVASGAIVILAATTCSGSQAPSEAT